MGFLHKLWDETLAGPAPDSGLGKLRKCKSVSASRSTSTVIDDNVPVSRSITILRANSLAVGSASCPTSAPSSPSGSATPGSPFSPTTPGGDFKKLTRRKKPAMHRTDPKSPTGYDWIVLSALDR